MALESLNQALNEIREGLADAISNPRTLKNLCTIHGLDLNNEECKDVLDKGVTDFRLRFNEKIHALKEECRVREKVVELGQIAIDSRELNKELGIDRGYRFSRPKDEISANVKSVLEAYKSGLDSEVDELKSDLEKLHEQYAAKYAIMKTKLKQMEDRLSN